MHNGSKAFVSATNVTMNGNTSRQPQPQHYHTPTRNQSTPYLTQAQENDRRPNGSSESDGGTAYPNRPNRSADGNQAMEKKFTDLVQQLRVQFDTDTEQLNEKLETKLKNLETMINQQTFVIQRQDDTIEKLKDQIRKLESERDYLDVQSTPLYDRDDRLRGDANGRTGKTAVDGLGPIQSLITCSDSTPMPTYENQTTYNNTTAIRKNSNASSDVREPSRTSSKKVRVLEHCRPVR